MCYLKNTENGEKEFLNELKYNSSLFYDQEDEENYIAKRKLLLIF
jgi:hypothetical protein